MRARIVLLGLGAALLAAYFFLVERPNWRASNERQDDERVVLRFDPERIIGVEVDHDGVRVVLERDDRDQWWIRAPIVYRVKEGAVRSFLERILQAERYYEVAESLEPERELDFGLDQATAALFTLRDRAAMQLHLRVGRETPTGDAFYFQRGGDPGVHLASDALNAIRLLDYQTLRDPTLFEIEREEIRELRVTTSAQSYHLQRDEKNLWRLAEAVGDIPQGTKLKQWLLRDAVYELSTARVRSYLRDGMTVEEWRVFGLGEQAPQLSWRGEATAGALAMGNESDQPGEIFARRLGEDTLFSFPSTLLDFVETSLADLVDLGPVDADFRSLLAIEARWPDGFELRSEGSGFQQETVVDGEIVDELSVVTQNVFYGLARPEILGRLDLDGARSLAELLGAEPVAITLRFEAESIRLEMGATADGRSYWMRPATGSDAYQIGQGVYLRIKGWRQAVESLG